MYPWSCYHRWKRKHQEGDLSPCAKFTCWLQLVVAYLCGWPGIVFPCIQKRQKSWSHSISRMLVCRQGLRIYTPYQTLSFMVKDEHEMPVRWLLLVCLTAKWVFGAQSPTSSGRCSLRCSILASVPHLHWALPLSGCSPPLSTCSANKWTSRNCQTRCLCSSLFMIIVPIHSGNQCKVTLGLGRNFWPGSPEWCLQRWWTFFLSCTDSLKASWEE